MWSRNNPVAVRSLAILAGGLATLTLSVPTVLAADDAAKICAEAEERFVEMFPDAKAEDGVEVVKMYKYTFCPPDLTVKKGSRVRFVNVDKRTSHSVWFKEAGDPESERMFPEESVEMVFPTPGTFDYLCGPHWDSDNMRARLTVTE